MPKGVGRKVENVLKAYPETRNSDKKLIMYVWKLYHDKDFMQDAGGKWWIDVDAIMDMPSPESIRRSRQTLQELGMYPATDPEVIKKRQKNYRKMTVTRGLAVDDLA